MAEAAAVLPMEEIPGQAPNTSQEAPTDYGDWNERLPGDLQNVLMELDKKYADEFRYARRLEVMKAWQARSFWREMQHLHWNWDSQWWDTLGPAGYNEANPTTNKKDTAVLYSTNVFQGFGDAFIAIITQAVPFVRFEPEEANDPADIETARESEPLRRIIQHQNDPIQLMTKAAYYGWCDGRMHGWSRWDVDKRYNKSRVLQDLYGTMEVKVPVIYEQVEEYNYLQFSTEYHLSTVRDKVRGRDFEDKNYWKKIQGGGKGSGQDIYERTARISVKQGISIQSAGGDAYSHLVTTRRSWMRPSCLMEDCVPDEKRDTLRGIFKEGIYLESDNGVYTGSKDKKMDDEWAVENIMEGDGSNRNAKGTCLVSVQERVNDTINTTHDTFEKAQPASHWDEKMFDIAAMKEQHSMPGARYGINLDDLAVGDTIANHVFFEPDAKIDPSQLAYLKELMTDVPEFLTGISSILFGADTGGDKSGKALQVQQSAAMGRVGLSFRVIKRLYARMMEQAVHCAAANSTDDLSVGIPDKNGVETVKARIESLSGRIRCKADADENYPETWVQRRATWMAIMQDGNADPIMRAILAHPRNQELGKNLLGLPEFEIPGADSWFKQSAEINYMLEESPQESELIQVPNPLTGNPETIQPPPQSSIPIDKDFDDHAAEFQTVVAWINSADGQKAKKENPEGFANVRLHGLAHKQALAAIQAAMAPPVPPAAPAAPHAMAKDVKKPTAPAPPGPASPGPAPSPGPTAATGLV